MTEPDFMIHGLYSYQFFGETVWITTSHVCIVIVLLALLGFALAARWKIRRAAGKLSAGEAPTGLVNMLELLVEKLDDMTEKAMGTHAPAFENYIGTVFLFLLFSNVSGLFGLRPPTADYGTTLALALITFTLIWSVKFRHQRSGQIWRELCSPLPSWLPLWVPVNLISELAIPVSLSLRLFANVLSGTVMLALVYGLLSKIAYVWPAALHAYFDLFSGAIQTYVFCMLTMTYIARSYDSAGEQTDGQE